MNYCNCPNCRTDNCPAALDRGSLIEGMELAMRIIRNRAKDAPTPIQRSEAQNCAGIIRCVQVEIGSGRARMPYFTKEELDEINRIR